MIGVILILLELRNKITLLKTRTWPSGCPDIDSDIQSWTNIQRITTEAKLGHPSPTLD
jgi:hypothetical protein